MWPDEQGFECGGSSILEVILASTTYMIPRPAIPRRIAVRCRYQSRGRLFSSSSMSTQKLRIGYVPGTGHCSPLFPCECCRVATLWCNSTAESVADSNWKNRQSTSLPRYISPTPSSDSPTMQLCAPSPPGPAQ